MDRVNQFFLQNALKGNLIATTLPKELKPTTTKETTTTRETKVEVKKGKGAEEKDLSKMLSQVDLTEDFVTTTPDKVLKKFFTQGDNIFYQSQHIGGGTLIKQLLKGEEKKEKDGVRAEGYKFKFSSKGGRILLSQSTVKWLKQEPEKMQNFYKLLEDNLVQAEDIDPKIAKQILKNVQNQLNAIISQLGFTNPQKILSVLGTLSQLISSLINFDLKKKLQKDREKDMKALKGEDYKGLEGQSKFGEMKTLGQKLAWFQSLEGMVQTELEQIELDPQGRPRREFLRKALSIIREVKLKLLMQSYKELEIVE